MKHLLVVVMICSCLIGFGIGEAAATATDRRYIFVESADIWMKINPDATIDVTETRRTRLRGAWPLMTREFLLLGCDDISILEVRSDGVRFKPGNLNATGEYLEERLGPRLHGRRSLTPRLNLSWRIRNDNEFPPGIYDTVSTLRYRITGAFGQFVNYDLLDCKPLWEQRREFIRRARIYVLFPEPVQKIDIDFECSAIEPRHYVSADQKMVTFSAKAISGDDTMEFSLRFPKGIIAPYRSFNNCYYYHIKPWVFPGFAGITVLLLLLIYRCKGRDPKMSVEQLAAISLGRIQPGFAGLITDESFESHDLAAMVFDLAGRGYLRLRELPGAATASTNCADYELSLIRMPEPGELNRAETALLHAVFGSPTSGASIDTRQLACDFYRRIGAIRAAAWQDVEELSWFAVPPRRARRSFMVGGLLIAAPGLLLAAIDIPIAVFFALWCTIIGGIPACRIIHAVKDFGLWRGIRQTVLYIPLVMLGAGVAVYALSRAYPGTGWTFDVGIAVFICGLLIAASGPAMTSRSPKGVITARRIRLLRNQLTGAVPDSHDLEPAAAAAWSVALRCETEFLKNCGDINPAAVFFSSPQDTGGTSGFRKAVKVLKSCLDIFPAY